MTPPKTILEKDLTLVESKCVPSALLHFGCDDDKVKEFIKPEYFEKLSSGVGASKVLLNSNESESDHQGASGIENSQKPSTSSIPKNFMDSKVASKPSGSVPKWFKPSN